MKLSQTRLLVDDFGACFRFYRDVIGLTPSFGDEESGYASFSSGDGTLALFQRDEQRAVVPLGERGDAALVVLEVESTDAEVSRLGDGIVAGPVSRPDWGGRVAYLRDPEGNLLELFQEIPMEHA